MGWRCSPQPEALALGTVLGWTQCQRAVLGGQGTGAICVFSAEEWGCYRADIKVKPACTSEKWELLVMVCSLLFGFQSTFLTSVLIKSVLP